MSGYVLGLAALALVCGLCGLLCPGGEGGSMAKPLRMLTGICLALYLSAPLAALAKGGVDVGAALGELLGRLGETETEDMRELSEGMYAQMDGAAAVLAIERELCHHFSLAQQDVNVSIRVCGESGQLLAVCVGLTGEAIWTDSHALEAWIGQNVGCDAVVYLE